MMSAAPFTPKELDDLADRLMLEFDERFEATDLDLMIGRMRWFWSIGIGLEINGEWDSFVAASRSLFWPPRWTILLDLRGLEETVRAYLEAQLRVHPDRRANS
jgi:hypothetical protein